MREILFRGKGNDGDWHFGCYCKTSRISGSAYLHMIHDFSSEGYFHFVDPETLSQYTGVSDRKSIMIFEGDIVKFKPDMWVPPKSSDGSLIGVVKYGYCTVPASDPHEYASYLGFYVYHNEGEYEFGGELGDPLTTKSDLFEVIGNIYDNPELLTPSVE